MRSLAAFSKEFIEGRSNGSPWPARGLLCLAVLVSYANVWPNEFVFNDGILIVQNQLLKHWSTLPALLTHLDNAGYGRPDGFYRPVQMLVYFLLYQAFGPSTFVFHALNIFLQALNACLLQHFGIRAGFKKGAAFAAALLWAVHPLLTNDVTYMTSTAEPLWGAFSLLGLITLLPDFTPQRVWKALIFFLLALGCKEPAVVFPAQAAIALFFVSKGRAPISAYLRTWPLWLAVAACYIAIRPALPWTPFGLTMDDSGVPVYTSHLATRIMTCLATLPVYARLIVWLTWACTH